MTTTTTTQIDRLRHHLGGHVTRSRHLSEGRRQQLAAAAAADTDAAQLAREVAAIAEIDASWGIYNYCNRIALSTPDFPTAARRIGEYLTDHLLGGADDTWSGRFNDVSRSKYDAVRAVAREVLTLLRTLERQS